MNNQQKAGKELKSSDQITVLTKENEKLKSDLFHAANPASPSERTKILKKYKIDHHIGRPKGSNKFTDQQLIKFYLTVERGRNSYSPPLSVRAFFIHCYPHNPDYNPGGIKDDQVFMGRSDLSSFLRTLQGNYKTGKNLHSAVKGVKEKST